MTAPGAHLGRRVLYYHLHSRELQVALITQVDGDGLLWLAVLDPVSGPIVRKRVALVAPGSPPPSQDSYCTWLMNEGSPVGVPEGGDEGEEEEEDDVYSVPGWLLTDAVNDLKALRREVTLLWRAQGRGGRRVSGRRARGAHARRAAGNSP
jgi:hypothetical protein